MKSQQPIVQRVASRMNRLAANLALFVALVMIAGWPGLAQLSDQPAPSPKLQKKLLKQVNRCLQTSAYAYGVDFSDWPQRIERDQQVLQSVSTSGEWVRALNRTLKSYEISHLFVMDPEIAKLRRAGSEIGVGLRTVPLPDSHDRLVNIVIPGGPADLAGLQRGDQIYAVNGERLDPDSLNYPFTPGGRPLGKEGDSLRLAWRRGSESHEASVMFTEHEAYLPLELKWPAEDTAWVTLNSFTSAGYSQKGVEKIFQTLRERGAKRLILDLRGNGGGRATNTLHLASFFLEPGTVLTRIFNQDPGIPPGESLAGIGEKEIQSIERGADRFRGQLAILTDRGSGSGGDAFPGVMQQVGGALIVGERTAGALIGGTYCELGRGFRMVYPLQERLLPDGTRLEGVGVQPDVPLGPVATVQDERILKATLEAFAKP